MEAQVENNVKKTNKQRKEKKKHMYRLQSLKNCGSGEK